MNDLIWMIGVSIPSLLMIGLLLWLRPTVQTWQQSREAAAKLQTKINEWRFLKGVVSTYIYGAEQRATAETTNEEKFKQVYRLTSQVARQAGILVKKQQLELLIEGTLKEIKLGNTAAVLDAMRREGQ